MFIVSFFCFRCWVPVQGTVCRFFFCLGLYVGFVGVCFWVSNERVVQDFSESFFFFGLSPGIRGAEGLFQWGFFVRDSEAVF